MVGYRVFYLRVKVEGPPNLLRDRKSQERCKRERVNTTVVEVVSSSFSVLNPEIVLTNLTRRSQVTFWKKKKDQVLSF